MTSELGQRLRNNSNLLSRDTELPRHESLRSRRDSYTNLHKISFHAYISSHSSVL